MKTKNILIIIGTIVIVAIILLAFVIILRNRQNQPSNLLNATISELDLTINDLDPEEDFEDIDINDFQYEDENSDEIESSLNTDLDNSISNLNVLISGLNPESDFDDIGDLAF